MGLRCPSVRWNGEFIHIRPLCPFERIRRKVRVRNIFVIPSAPCRLGVGEPIEMEPGTQVSHYKILRKLGAGGMGEVYQAEDVNLRRKVALKFLLPQTIGDEKAKKRFWREARYAASFQDPHIATVYEIGETDGQIFIAMEYIEGDTLRNRIRERPLTTDETIRFSIQILRALDKAHQRKIIHRDIKSANILITPESEVKILDFGLAKAIHQERSPAHGEESVTIESLTAEQAVVGTIDYMSPEILKGMEADEGSDLYAVGIVLYEMVTGKLPYSGVTFAEKIAAKLNRPAVSPDDPAIPPAFRPILMRALHPLGEKRYQHAREMLADVQTVGAGQPLNEATVVDLILAQPKEDVTRVIQAPLRPGLSIGLLVALTIPSVLFAGSLSLWWFTDRLVAGVIGTAALPVLFAVAGMTLGGRSALLRRILDVCDRRMWVVTAIALVSVTAGAIRILNVVGLGWLGDWRYEAWVRPEEPSRDIVLVDLDDASRRKFIDSGETEAKNLPYWRKFHGPLLQRILEHGAPKAIAFDLYFSDPSPFDSEFASALRLARQQKVPVVLGQRFYPAEAKFSVTVDTLKQAITGPDGQPTLGQNFALESPARRLPLIIREVNTLADQSVADIKSFPSFVLLILTGGTFDEKWLVPGERIETPEESIPLDPAYVSNARLGRFEFENLSLSFPTKDFDHYSYHDVYSGKLAENVFRNRYVIIGSAYEEFESPTQIPNRTVYPFHIHASALDTLKRRAFTGHARPPSQALAVLFGPYLLYALWVGVRRKGRWLRFAVAGGSLTLALILGSLSLVLFRAAHLWFDSGYAILASIATGIYILVSHPETQGGG